MRKYATTYIFALSLLVGEVHTFWEKRPVENQNWIIKRHVPMSIQWNVKLAGDQLNYILYFIAMWCYGRDPNKVNRTTVLSFIMLAVLDTGMYFYNYKTYWFGFTYLGLAVFWIWMYVGKGLANHLWSKLHRIK